MTTNCLKGIQPCGCDDCNGSCQFGTVPAQYSVVFSGLSNTTPGAHDGACPNCTSLNGVTYILDRNGVNGSGYCRWTYDLPSPICDFTRIEIVQLLGILQVFIEYWDGSVNQFDISFASAIGSPPVNCAYSSKVVNFDLATQDNKTGSPYFGFRPCLFTGSTATVTAL